MDTKLMTETARAMVAPGKGLLAADESAGTCEKRFDSVGVECNEENRRAYRELLFTTPALAEQYVSGRDPLRRDDPPEDERRRELRRVPGGNGILPGIKVDKGAKDLALCPGEKVTEGLDGLRQRLAEYFKLGARFAKWRAVITIGEGIPSHACLYANAHALARYAAICQEASIVPIVEPEVLLDGDHTIERCEEVTEATLRGGLRRARSAQRLARARHPQGEHGGLGQGLRAPGGRRRSRRAHGARAQAHRAGGAARRGVPFRRPGRPRRHRAPERDDRAGAALPWPLTFSLLPRAAEPSRSRPGAARPQNVAAAQKALHHRARMNSLACQRASGSRSRQAARRGVKPLYSSPAIASLPRVGRGKVRDIYAVGDDRLLIVATDRLSAFDVVLPDPIPGKGGC